MNYPRTILAAVVAATSVCAAYAQEATPEDVVATEAAVEAKSVQTMVDEYLNAKGYSEGENAWEELPEEPGDDEPGDVYFKI